jgi:uncharacterized integral membrane protein
MRRFLFYCLVIPLAIVIIVVAVANRHVVTVSFDPFNTTAPALSFAIPLFVLLFAVLVAGVIVGGVAVWFRQGHWRKMARTEKVTVDRLQREVEARRHPPAGPALPAA